MLRAAMLVLLAACVGVAVAGCGDPPKKVTTAVLDGTDWASTSVEGRTLVAGSKLTLSFQADRLAASAGCNRLVGTYTLTRDVLAQRDQARTQMACEGLGAQEDWFAEFLRDGAKVLLLDYTLTLSRGTTKIVFERAKPSGPSPIVGTLWTLMSSTPRGGDTTQVDDATRAPTLEIAADGTAAIFTGCNRAKTTAEEDSGFVIFGPVASTMMACDGQAGELEQAVLKVLDGKVAAGFSGEGDLSLAKDGNQLLYRAK